MKYMAYKQGLGCLEYLIRPWMIFFIYSWKAAETMYKSASKISLLTNCVIIK